MNILRKSISFGMILGMLLGACWACSDDSNGRGIPLTGLSNARPETLAIKDEIQRTVEALPFDINDVIELDIPGGKVEGREVVLDAAPHGADEGDDHVRNSGGRCRR